MEETDTIKEHLRNLKRVETDNARGERVGSWVATGPDHYGHSLNYLNMADDMMDFRGKHMPVAAIPMMQKVRINTEPAKVTSTLIS
jgi:hypothetical protein